MITKTQKNEEAVYKKIVCKPLSLANADSAHSFKVAKFVFLTLSLNIMFYNSFLLPYFCYFDWKIFIDITNKNLKQLLERMCEVFLMLILSVN